MNKVLFAIICFLPLLSVSQEIEKQLESKQKLKNHLPYELRNLKLDEDVFSLHIGNLLAEQGVKCLLPP